MTDDNKFIDSSRSTDIEICDDDGLKIIATIKMMNMITVGLGYQYCNDFGHNFITTL